MSRQHGNMPDTSYPLRAMFYNRLEKVAREVLPIIRRTDFLNIYEASTFSGGSIFLSLDRVKNIYIREHMNLNS
jgi:hypothetical protein